MFLHPASAGNAGKFYPTAERLPLWRPLALLLLSRKDLWSGTTEMLMWKEASRASQQQLQAQGVPDVGVRGCKLGEAQMGWIGVGSTDLCEVK